jgi:hypothetical protein
MGRTLAPTTLLMLGWVALQPAVSAQGSGSPRVILNETIDGATVRLVEEARDENGRRSVLTIAKTDGNNLRATITQSASAVAVTGTIAGVPYSGEWSGTNGRLERVRLSNGSASVEFDPSVIDDAVLDQYARVRNSFKTTPIASLIDTIRRAVERTGSPDDAAPLLIVAHAVRDDRKDDDVVDPNGAIGDYMDCLREGCTDSGLCWGGNGCEACPGMPFGQAFAAALVFELAAEICWFELIISPICFWC